jgi:hypothetical protein
MLKGTSEEVMVNSDPLGAQVTINNQDVGTTPYDAKLPSDQVLHVHVSKAGYQPQDITDDTKFRWGYEIWSFFAYIIPLVVDLADGAAWGHEQTMIAAHLEPVPPQAATVKSEESTIKPAVATTASQVAVPVAAAAPNPVKAERSDQPSPK